jgi:hypothetical protein
VSLLDPIDNYCERTAAELLAEPLNAVSNVAFFIAACLLWRRYVREGVPHRPSVILIVLLALIGVGSSLFHTFANGLTMLGDVIPISIFTFTYLWFALRLLLGVPRMSSLALLGVFAVAGGLAPQVPPQLQFNGSVAYFPCLFALFIISFALLKKNRAAGLTIFRAASWFCVSLLYRSIDMKLCPMLPHGTHFLWHTINGRVLFLLVCAVMPRRQTT